jgi:LEA14-like dessication related protein
MMSMRAAALVTTLGLLGGCVYTHLEQPTLSVVNVELVKADLFQQQLHVRMRVQNPNDLNLAVRSISYEVEIAGNAFAHGDSVSEFVVPARDGAEFDVNVTANAAAAVLRLLAGGKGDAEYRIFGKVRLSSGLMRTIPFDHKGMLRLH